MKIDRPSHIETIRITSVRLRTASAAMAAMIAFFPVSAFSADLDANEPGEAPQAQQFDAARYGDFRDTLKDWKVTIGAGAIYMPEYEGSDKFDINPFPLIFAKIGDRVEIDTTGITVDLFERDGFRVGIKGGYNMGRQEKDSDYLRGLGDIDAAGVIGGVVSYERGPFEVYGSLHKTIGGSDGMAGKVGAKASYRYDRFIFSADVSGTWADDKEMQTYFGVTTAQSAASGLDRYDAKAGVKRIDMKASVTYMMTQNWMVTGAAGAGVLMGDAKDSPIVMDDVQPFAMLGVAYRF